eukprot:3773202-Rhodomonas_salina.1
MDGWCRMREVSAGPDRESKRRGRWGSGPATWCRARCIRRGSQRPVESLHWEQAQRSLQQQNLPMTADSATAVNPIRYVTTGHCEARALADCGVDLAMGLRGPHRLC